MWHCDAYCRTLWWEHANFHVQKQVAPLSCLTCLRMWRQHAWRRGGGRSGVFIYLTIFRPPFGFFQSCRSRMFLLGEPVKKSRARICVELWHFSFFVFFSKPVFSARSRQILDYLNFSCLWLDSHEKVNMDTASFRPNGKNFICLLYTSPSPRD